MLLKSPPSLPLNPINLHPIFLAEWSALITFLLEPPVLIPIKMSPCLANASTWRSNKYWNPKSLPTAVRIELSVVRAIAESALRSVLYLPTISAAICCASAALPPLPHSSILLPFLRLWMQVIAAFSTKSLTLLIVSFVILKVLQKTIGLRVSDNDEIGGLDLNSHGESAYNDWFNLNHLSWTDF